MVDRDVAPATADPTEREALPSERVRSLSRADLVLASVAVGIFLANLFVSLALPTEGLWETNRGTGYRLHLMVSFTGFYLLGTPLAFLARILQGGEVTPTFGALLGWWLAAVLAIVLVARCKHVPVWRRALYAYLIGAQLAGFMAVHYSTLGN